DERVTVRVLLLEDGQLFLQLVETSQNLQLRRLGQRLTAGVLALEVSQPGLRDLLGPLDLGQAVFELAELCRVHRTSVGQLQRPTARDLRELVLGLLERGLRLVEKV